MYVECNYIMQILLLWPIMMMAYILLLRAYSVQTMRRRQKTTQVYIAYLNNGLNINHWSLIQLLTILGARTPIRSIIGLYRGQPAWSLTHSTTLLLL